MINVLGVQLHGYGLMIGLGILAASSVSSWLSKRRGYDKELVENGLWWVIIPAIIGARMYHVVDYWWYYGENLGEIVKLWNGGMGIWGGVIGGAVGAAVFNRKGKYGLRDLFDIAAIGVPLGQAIGRVGNAINGELAGSRGEPLWAIEAGLNLILFGLLIRLAKRNEIQGRIAAAYLVGYGVIRMGLEWLRPPQQSWDVFGLPVAVVVGMMAAVTGLWWYKKSSR